MQEMGAVSTFALDNQRGIEASLWRHLPYSSL